MSLRKDTSSLKVAVMQPYFLPYVGYFSLIKHANLWVVFDTPQFIRHGWIERNRVLNPKEGWQYIKVPLVKHSRDIAIKDVRIRVEEPWQELLLAQIAHYKRSAPHYRRVASLLSDALWFHTDSIATLDVFLLQRICQYLEVPFNHQMYSETGLGVSNSLAPDEWGLEITRSLGGDEYLNLPGGRNWFDNSKYVEAGILLTFIKPSLARYDQKRETFEQGLSIIDVMMYNDPAAVRQMLDDIEWVSGDATL